MNQTTNQDTNKAISQGISVFELLSVYKIVGDIRFYNKNGFMFQTTTQFANNIPEVFTKNAKVIEFRFSNECLMIDVDDSDVNTHVYIVSSESSS